MRLVNRIPVLTLPFQDHSLWQNEVNCAFFGARCEGSRHRPSTLLAEDRVGVHDDDWPRIGWPLVAHELGSEESNARNKQPSSPKIARRLLSHVSFDKSSA